MPSGPLDARKRVRSASNVPAELVAAQYFGTVAASGRRSPERRLMAAVLLDAVVQLAKHGSRGAIEAAEWVRAGDAPGVALSFARVCEILDLDAAYLARGLLGLRVSWAKP